MILLNVFIFVLIHWRVQHAANLECETFLSVLLVGQLVDSMEGGKCFALNVSRCSNMWKAMTCALLTPWHTGDASITEYSGSFLYHKCQAGRSMHLGSPTELQYV